MRLNVHKICLKALSLMSAALGCWLIVFSIGIVGGGDVAFFVLIFLIIAALSLLVSYGLWRAAKTYETRNQSWIKPFLFSLCALVIFIGGLWVMGLTGLANHYHADSAVITFIVTSAPVAFLAATLIWLGRRYEY